MNVFVRRLYKSQKKSYSIFIPAYLTYVHIQQIIILRYLQINKYLQKITQSLGSLGWISQLALADLPHRISLDDGNDLVILFEPGTAEHLLDLQQARAAGIGDEEVREGHSEGVRKGEGPDPEVDAEHRLDGEEDLDRQEGAGEADAVY